MKPDVTITSHGTIFTFKLNTQQAIDWVTMNVQDDAQFFGSDNLVVEHRYAHGIAEVMASDGLILN